MSTSRYVDAVKRVREIEIRIAQLSANKKNYLDRRYMFDCIAKLRTAVESTHKDSNRLIKKYEEELIDCVTHNLFPADVGEMISLVSEYEQAVRECSREEMKLKKYGKSV